jgi:hypothetical protein
VKRQAMSVDREPAGVYFGTTSGDVWASRDEGRTCRASISEIYAVEVAQREGPCMQVRIPSPLRSYTKCRSVHASGATLASPRRPRPTIPRNALRVIDGTVAFADTSSSSSTGCKRTISRRPSQRGEVMIVCALSGGGEWRQYAAQHSLTPLRPNPYNP